jgi:uncharacterized protein Yka (UPF0111/DUF47 family)
MEWKRLFMTGAAMALTASFALAQTVDDAIELERAVIQTERQAITAASLGLSDSESAAFWPVYRQYRAEIAKVDDRLVDLIKKYAARYDSMTEATAKSLVDDLFAFEQKKLKVSKRYLRKFRKAVPEKKVARFIQIENKLDAILRYQLAADIPLVR